MSKDNIEYRNFSGFSALPESDGKLKIKGYFTVYGQESRDLPNDRGYKVRETIAPGALDKSLQNAEDVKALAFHNPNLVLGRMKNKTLQLRSDDKGLYAEVELPNTQFARDLYESVKGGYIDEASFGFKMNDHKWEQRDGYHHRIVKEAELIEVSIVSKGAYAQPHVSARSLDALSEEIKQEEVKLEEIKKHNEFLLELEIEKTKLILDENS